MPFVMKEEQNKCEVKNKKKTAAFTDIFIMIMISAAALSVAVACLLVLKPD